MPKGIHDERYRALIEVLVGERKRLGLSQQNLADRVGLPQQVVSRFEIGDRRLDMVEFIDIAGALGLSAVTLIKDVAPRIDR